MHWLFSLEIYLPIAIIVFAVAASFAGRISRRLPRSLVRGFIAALLFGGAAIPLGHGGAFVFPAWRLIAESPSALLYISIFVLPWLAVQTAVFAAGIYSLDAMIPAGSLREEWRTTVRELRNLRRPTSTRDPIQWRWLLLPVVPVLIAGVIVLTVVIMDARRESERAAAMARPAVTWRAVSAPVAQPAAQWQELACNEADSSIAAGARCYRLVIITNALTDNSMTPPAPGSGIATVRLDGSLPGGVKLLVVNDSNGKKVSISYGQQASIVFKQGDRFHLAPAIAHDVRVLAPQLVPHEIKPEIFPDSRP